MGINIVKYKYVCADCTKKIRCDMDNELKHVIKNVSEKTGISFNVAPYGSEGLPSGIKSGKIMQNANTGKTYFSFAFRGEVYVAAVTGTDRVTANYAYLLHDLLENYGSSDVSLDMNEYLKKILAGDCSKLQVQKFHVKFNVPDIACYAVVLSCPKDLKAEIRNVLESYSSNTFDTPVDTDDGNIVLVKFADAADSEYRSPGEFAEYLAQSMFEELGINVSVGVGTVMQRLSDLHSSYQQALTALNMSKVFNSKGNVHSYKEYVFVKMLEELPRAKLLEYLADLTGEEGKEIFGDPDMVNTAEEFLENSLNVSETSRELFMHRNTLMYRLDKIEKATGLNIRNFSDALTFRLITVLSKLLG